MNSELAAVLHAPDIEVDNNKSLATRGDWRTLQVSVRSVLSCTKSALYRSKKKTAFRIIAALVLVSSRPVLTLAIKIKLR